MKTLEHAAAVGVFAMIDPKIRYDYNFTTYYTYKLTHRRISTRFIQIAGTIFLATSIALSVYFRFFPT